MGAEIQIWNLFVGLHWWPKVQGYTWRHWLLSAYIDTGARMGAVYFLGFRLGYEW